MLLVPFCSEQKKGSLPAEEKKDMEEMQRNILKRKAQLHEIEQTLPQKNSAYLKVSESNIHLSNCITPPLLCVCVCIRVETRNRAEIASGKSAQMERWSVVISYRPQV